MTGQTRPSAATLILRSNSLVSSSRAAAACDRCACCVPQGGAGRQEACGEWTAWGRYWRHGWRAVQVHLLPPPAATRRGGGRCAGAAPLTVSRAQAAAAAPPPAAPAPAPPAAPAAPAPPGAAAPPAALPEGRLPRRPPRRQQQPCPWPLQATDLPDCGACPGCRRSTIEREAKATRASSRLRHAVVGRRHVQELSQLLLDAVQAVDVGRVEHDDGVPLALKGSGQHVQQGAVICSYPPG